MADRKLSYSIGVDSTQGQTGIRNFARTVQQELKKTEDSFDDTRTAGQRVADVLGQLAGELETELRDAATAADALATALGPELSARVDVGSVVGDLQRMGLTTQDIAADADTLAASLKQLDDVRLQGVQSGLGGVQTKLGAVRGDTDQTRSVFANFTGNIASELPGVAGAFGPLNMAVGQFAEYAAEGNIAMGNLIAAAGPMAAMAASFLLIQSAMDSIADQKAFDKDQVKRFSDAIKDGKDALGALTDELESTGEIAVPRFAANLRDALPDWAGGISGTQNVTDDLARLGLSVEHFAALVEGGEPALQTWMADLEASGVDLADYVPILHAAADAHDNWTEAQKAQQANAKLLRPILTANAIAQQRLAAEEQQRADRLDDYNAAQQRATEGAEAYADALRSTDFKGADLTGAITGMSKFNDEAFALVNIAQDVEESFAAFGDTLVTKTEDGEKRIKLTGDVATEAGRAQQDAIEGVARALESQFAAAYDNADGSLRRFRRNARDIGDNTLAKLRDEFNLTDDEVAFLRDQLNLTATDYEARFEVSGTEEAMTKVGLLQTSIDNLPEDVQTQVTQQIIAGDYQGALDTIQDFYDKNPATVDLYVTPQYPSGFINQGGGLVPGPRGPVPVPEPTGFRGAPAAANAPVGFAAAAVVPVPVAPTRVEIDVNLNAEGAIIGDPFSTMRAIEDGMRRAARLMPTLP